MKILYIDCSMGAAGDMLTAALTELLPDPDAFIKKLNALNIPGVSFERIYTKKCGMTGTQMKVTVNGAEEHSEDVHHEHEHHHHEHHHDHNHEHEHHHHHHSSMADIESIVNALDISEKVKADVMAVYGLIAQAESSVHGTEVTQIHFHEVGSMDAVADITAVCMLIEELSPDRIEVSPIHVGSGQIGCAHGILPVPAPATAYILKGVPIYGGRIEGELCTPTGAALLKYFADSFGAMPAMAVSGIGYGMGKKDFDAANCVRAMIGESADSVNSVCQLSCNVDDMTAEEMGYALKKLYDGGALEAYTIPIGMKKSRPGILLSVLCRREDKESMISLIFKHTSTIGIREAILKRYVMERRSETLETPYGSVRRKLSGGYGVSREKLEYDDVARIADEKDISLEEAKRLILKCGKD